MFDLNRVRTKLYLGNIRCAVLLTEHDLLQKDILVFCGDLDINFVVTVFDPNRNIMHSVSTPQGNESQKFYCLPGQCYVRIYAEADGQLCHCYYDQADDQAGAYEGLSANADGRADPVGVELTQRQLVSPVEVARQVPN